MVLPQMLKSKQKIASSNQSMALSVSRAELFSIRALLLRD